VSAERFERALASLEADRAVDIAETYAAIEAAANDGSPRAALLAAYAAGVGYGRTVDVNAAFGWLRTAVERGDPQAQVQLQIVAQNAIDEWISARPTRIVSERPRIGMSDGFLTPQLCAWLIERSAPLQEASYVYDPKTGRPVVDDARTNSAATFKLTDLDLPLTLIRHRIANTLGVPAEHFERTSVFRYRVGQTFADHADYISTSFSAEIRQRGQRPWTFLVYLNDTFEGGETHFLRIDKKIRGGVGDALFWRNVDDKGAPDEQSQHAGVPPTSGEKWLLSQFIRDKPQMPG
jgi:prolyl 4-hydroxylase